MRAGQLIPLIILAFLVGLAVFAETDATPPQQSATQEPVTPLCRWAPFSTFCPRTNEVRQ